VIDFVNVTGKKNYFLLRKRCNCDTRGFFAPKVGSIDNTWMLRETHRASGGQFASSAA